MHPSQGKMEKVGEHVVKSCRNLVQTEIRSLRDDLGSLRGFLRNCQDTINSETTRLEKKCLGKIETLEEERVNLEKVINTLKEENEDLRKSYSEFSAKLSGAERELRRSQENESRLQLQIKSLESQLSTKNTQCQDFCKKLESAKLRCLALENKLASNEAYVKEQKTVLHEMATDNKHLECNTKDLQMRAAESEEYEKALESHIEELEAICSILREQHDEQHKYFLQKESSLKRELQEIQRNLENENKKLSSEIDVIKTKLESESAKYQEAKKAAQKKEIQLQEKETMLIESHEKLDSIKHDYQIEKATVEMLSRKNQDLSEEIGNMRNKITVLEEKSLISNENLINRKALTEIGNTVQQYIDDNSSLTKKLESSLIASNNERLEECERQLVFERQKRLNAEMDSANLSVELEKAKVEIAIYRSNISDSSRRRSDQNSKSNLLALPGLNSISNNSCHNEHGNLLPITPAAETAPPANSQFNNSADQMSIHSDGSDIAPLSGNNAAAGGPAVSQVSENKSRSGTPDINNALAVTEISISDRASRKMEEATRKALEMLNQSKTTA